MGTRKSTHRLSRQLAALAAAAALLGSGTVSAQQTTSTVSTSNTADTAYTLIAPTETYGSAIQVAPNQDLTVWMAEPTAGAYNVITNGGICGRSNTTLTINGPLKINSSGSVMAIDASGGNIVVNGNVNIYGDKTTYALFVANAASVNSTTVAINGDFTANIKNVNPEAVVAFGDSAIAYHPTVNFKGNVKIVTEPTETWGSALALSAYNKGLINAGTDGMTSLGKVVQIEGDVWVGADGTINLMLDQPASYLQGNVSQEAGSTFNMTLQNGGTWHPAYDNRYGSYNTNPMDTHDKSYSVSGVSIGSLTLATGGIVDMTWDNTARTTARTLSIDNLSGTGGIFRLNTNLAAGTGDSIAVGSSSTATSAAIQIAYDPAYLTSSDATGSVKVVTSSPTTMIFNPRDTEYQDLVYTPVLSSDGTGAWTLTGLKATARVSENTKTVADAGAALGNMWLAETNNLQKRMGDLRTMSPADAGAWARYNYIDLRDDNARDDEVKGNMLQAGYDQANKVTGGVVYTGGAVSYTKGTASFANGGANLHEATLSLYQSWVGDDGHYTDIILKGGRYFNDYGLAGTTYITGNYSTWGTSLSGEFGYRKTLANGMYVEPQAELILGHVQGTDYTTSDGMKANLESMNRTIVRFGAALGQKFDNGTVYSRASYYHGFGGNTDITATGTAVTDYNRNAARNWYDIAIGGTMQAGRDCTVYAELEKDFGDIKSDVQVNAGARWKF